MDDIARFYFDINPLPLVDDEPEVPEVYFVSTCSGVIIASFDNYDDAVDLICLMEEFCESRNLFRKEY